MENVDWICVKGIHNHSMNMSWYKKEKLLPFCTCFCENNCATRKSSRRKPHDWGLPKSCPGGYPSPGQGKGTPILAGLEVPQSWLEGDPSPRQGGIPVLVRHSPGQGVPWNQRPGKEPGTGLPPERTWDQTPGKEPWYWGISTGKDLGPGTFEGT